MARELIVHPTDLGAVSEDAFFHALRLALAAHAELLVAHAHDYATEEVPSLDAFPRVRETLAKWGMLPEHAEAMEVSESLGLHVGKGEVLSANAEAGMAKLLRDKDAAMVVLGTRGLAGLRRLVEESFSEHLARDAHIPALFVPEGVEGFVKPATGAMRLANILIPVTEDPPPQPAVDAAIRMSDLAGQQSRLHFLHVGHGTAPKVTVPEGRARNDISRQGPVVEAIAEAAEATDADLIVMATAGHKHFMDALKGSTTEGVIRKARHAVLAIPAIPPAARTTPTALPSPAA